jgi:hypothetical protein
MFPFYLDKPLGQLIFQTTIYRFATSSSKDHLCGLCTGSERDAVLFFIQDQDDEIEQQRKMFFQIIMYIF